MFFKRLNMLKTIGVMSEAIRNKKDRRAEI